MKTYLFSFLVCFGLIGCAGSGQKPSHHKSAAEVNDSVKDLSVVDSVIPDSPLDTGIKNSEKVSDSKQKVKPAIIVREMPRPGVSDQDKRYIDSVKAAKKKMK